MPQCPSGCFSVPPHLYASEHHVHFLPITCLPPQPTSHTQSVLAPKLALRSFSHFTGFKPSLFLSPSGISKTNSVKEDKFWLLTSSFPCEYLTCIFLAQPLQMLSACCLCPLQRLPQFPPLLIVSSVTPYPLMPSLPNARTLTLFSAHCLSGTPAYFVFERAPGMLWA